MPLSLKFDSEMIFDAKNKHKNEEEAKRKRRLQSNLAIVNFLRSSKKFTIARSLLLKGFDQYSNVGITSIY